MPTDIYSDLAAAENSTLEQKKPVGYFQLTRTATYSFLAALPLFVLYELLILFANLNRSAQIRIGADIWIKRLLGNFGLTSHLALGIFVIAVGLAIFLTERNKRIPVRSHYFGLLIGESLLYAFFLGMFISQMIGRMFSMSTGLLPFLFNPSQSGGLILNLALSLGAGLYEELFFRVMLVGGLFLLLKMFTKNKITAYFISAIIGALLFSAVHYIGIFGDQFTLSSFMFRFTFGLALNALFLVRGFGVAAWTHALYDVFVMIVW